MARNSFMRVRQRRFLCRRLPRRSSTAIKWKEQQKEQTRIHSAVAEPWRTGSREASFRPNEALSSEFDRWLTDRRSDKNLYANAKSNGLDWQSPRSISNQLTDPSIITAGCIFLWLAVGLFKANTLL